MTHEIKVKVKVQDVAGEIVFYVSDMPRIESSVRKNLANFDNWQYAKWTEKSQEHCIYSQQGETRQEEARFEQLKVDYLKVIGTPLPAVLGAIEHLELVQDGIKIALITAGYNVANMTGFEQACALQEMAQEYIANRESLAHYEYVFDDIARGIANVRKRE